MNESALVHPISLSSPILKRRYALKGKFPMHTAFIEEDSSEVILYTACNFNLDNRLEIVLLFRIKGKRFGEEGIK